MKSLLPKNADHINDFNNIAILILTKNYFPKLEYSVFVYDSAKYSIIDSLNIIRNLPIQFIIGAMQISLITSLHVEANLLPFKDRRILLHLNYHTNHSYRNQILITIPIFQSTLNYTPEKQKNQNRSVSHARCIKKNYIISLLSKQIKYTFR